MPVGENVLLLPTTAVGSATTEAPLLLLLPSPPLCRFLRDLSRVLSRVLSRFLSRVLSRVLSREEVGGSAERERERDRERSLGDDEASRLDSLTDDVGYP